MNKKKYAVIGIAILLLAATVFGLVFTLQNETRAGEITKEEAETFVNQSLDRLAVSKAMASIAAANSVAVENITYGTEKDILLDCTVETLDVHGALSPSYDAFLSADEMKPGTTMFKSSLNFKLEFEPLLATLLASAEPKTTACQITLYETRNGLVLYASDEVINAVFGGLYNFIFVLRAIREYILAA